VSGQAETSSERLIFKNPFLYSLLIKNQQFFEVLIFPTLERVFPYWLLPLRILYSLADYDWNEPSFVI